VTRADLARFLFEDDSCTLGGITVPSLRPMMLLCPKCKLLAFRSGEHAFFDSNNVVYDCYECGYFAWDESTQSEHPLPAYWIADAKSWGAYEDSEVGKDHDRSQSP